MHLKTFVKNIPIVGSLAQRLYRMVKSEIAKRRGTIGSKEYWEKRYSTGGNSGAGSYGKFAELKAGVINEFVAKHKIQSVIEFGCGDGNQLGLAQYRTYLGFDPSPTAVSRCRERYGQDPSKEFRLLSDYRGETADLALSLDVVYHLLEDAVFENHMVTLFGSATNYVIIYSSDSDDNRGDEGTHVRHRRFTRWIDKNLPAWRLVSRIANRYPYRGDHSQGSFADFYIYQMRLNGAPPTPRRVGGLPRPQSA